MPFKKFMHASSGWVGVVAVSLLLVSGCSRKTGDTGKSYAMGEGAKVGQLTYTVVETEWKEAIDGSLGQRLPKHRFLIVNLNIVNSGEAEVGVPFLTLIDAKGVEFREEDKADGVASWLGYLRRATPSETLGGRILFDVPPGGYKLRISSGGEAETETTAVVDLPYRADAPSEKVEEPVAAPSTK
jgi:Domain of unknown function (DUF4352)